MFTTISIRKAAIIGAAVFLLTAKSCHCLSQSTQKVKGQASYEAADIHFRIDNKAGIQMGKELGKYMAEAPIKR